MEQDEVMPLSRYATMVFIWVQAAENEIERVGSFRAHECGVLYTCFKQYSADVRKQIEDYIADGTVYPDIDIDKACNLLGLKL